MELNSPFDLPMHKNILKLVANYQLFQLSCSQTIFIIDSQRTFPDLLGVGYIFP